MVNGLHFYIVYFLAPSHLHKVLYMGLLFTHTFVCQWLACFHRLGGSRIWTSNLLLLWQCPLHCEPQSPQIWILYLTGLDKNFNQWDPLIDGEDENLIKGTNVITLQSAIWTACTCCSAHLSDCWLPAWWLQPLRDSPRRMETGLLKDVWEILWVTRRHKKDHLYLTSRTVFSLQINRVYVYIMCVCTRPTKVV